MSNQHATGAARIESTKVGYERVIDEICNLNWATLNEEDLIRVAWAYYHFSVQFRECLEIAREMYPDDERLLQLDHGERNTDNLSASFDRMASLRSASIFSWIVIDRV